MIFKKYLKGFNYLELMTAAGIAGVLGVVGVQSVRSKRTQSRSSQAQYALSQIYQAEKNFHNQWGTYHENLYLIGAVPSGRSWYDAGFTQSATLSSTDGRLGDSPFSTSQITTKSCNDYHQICDHTCASAVAGTGSTAVYGAGGTHGGRTYQAIICAVEGGLLVKDSTDTFDAKKDEFDAIARSKLRSNDEWTIDEAQTVTHKTDGT